MGKKVPIFGISKNPISPCLLSVLLFDLSISPRGIALVKIQIWGRMDPKNIPTVSQQITAAGGPQMRDVRIGHIPHAEVRCHNLE